jgi:hypothetical protein
LRNDGYWGRDVVLGTGHWMAFKFWDCEGPLRVARVRALYGRAKELLTTRRLSWSMHSARGHGKCRGGPNPPRIGLDERLTTAGATLGELEERCSSRNRVVRGPPGSLFLDAQHPFFSQCARL